MRAPALILTALAGLAVLQPLPGFAQNKQAVKLDAVQARVAAWRALQMGQPALALKIAAALAKKTTGDFELIFLQAQALLALGQHGAAVSAAKDAFQNADSQGESFDAAHLVAKGYFAKGRKTQAQFWLRRATQLAPDRRAASLSKRDFQFIRRTNPFSTRGFFSLFPTSNINNGSLTSAVWDGSKFLNTKPSDRPHSGTGLTLGFETTYRKALNKRTELRFGVFALGTVYQLSSEAKALGSGKTAADFAFGTVEARFGLSRLSAKKSAGRFTFDAALGHSWYGGNPLSVHYRLDFSKEARINARLSGKIGVGFNVQNRFDNTNASSKSGKLSFELTQRLGKGQQLRYSVSAQQSRSKSTFVEYTALDAQVRYSLPEIAWDIRPTLSLGYKFTDYPDLIIGGVQRQDRQLDASLSLFFPKASYYGFAPSMTLSASRNNSSIGIYSTRDLRISFGISSTF